MMLWRSKPKRRGSIPGWAESSFTLVSVWKKPIRLLNSWHGGLMGKTVVYQGQRSRGRGSIPSRVKSTFKLVSEWEKPIRKLQPF